MSLDELRVAIAQRSAFFDRMVDLIPPVLYNTNPEDNPNIKYQHSKKPKPAELKELKKQAKKIKLDPESNKLNTEIQKEKAEEQDQARDESPVNLPLYNPSTTRVASIAELRERVQNRIKELRRQRGVDPDGDDNCPKSKRSREDILEERRKKKELQKRKIQQAKLKLNPTPKNASQTMKLDETKKRKSSSDDQPVVDQLTFAKVDFGEEIKNKKQKLDPKTALKKVEKQKEKLTAIKEADPEKAKKIEEKNAWNKVMAMASGEKLQDNAKLLKKTIKRKEKKKEKSKQSWDERKKAVDDGKNARQQKREENIKKRIDDKKAKKMGLKTKSSKAPSKKRAGF